MSDDTETEFSVNERAEKLMGRRPTWDDGVVSIDEPCELGYRCPVCMVGPMVDGDYDQRLTWSEYEGFLWCSVCDKDYPSCFCVPLDAEPDPKRHWWNAGVDAAVTVFLDQIAEAQARARESADA